MEALLLLFLSGMISMAASMFGKNQLALAAALLGMVGAIFLMALPAPLFQFASQYQGIAYEGFQIHFSILCITLTALIIWGDSLRLMQDKENGSDTIALYLFSLCGVLILIGFKDLFMFFLGLEIMSIPLYVLAGSDKNSSFSREAAVKYFFTGSFITCFILLGIALIYGATGTFELSEMKQVILEAKVNLPMLQVGTIMLAIGFLFKVGAAPFHFWGPDVYQGSPNYITAFMASTIKIAMLFSFYTFFSLLFEPISKTWIPLLQAAILISLFLGYLVALHQTYFKRLLAYSSITHSAFALFSLLCFKESSLQHLFIFTIGYGFSIVGLVSSQVAMRNTADQIDQIKGKGLQYPLLGLLWISALFSLTGLPPFTGFFGKTFLFYEAFSHFPALVMAGLISTAIGSYFYLQLIMHAFQPESDQATKTPIPLALQAILLLCICSICGGWLFIFWI